MLTSDGLRDLETMLRQSGAFDERSKRAQRWLLANAVEVQPDNQSRITIPQEQRAWAGITKDVVIIGVGDRVEIWDTQKWQTYEERLSDNLMQDILSSGERGGSS